MKLSVLQLVTNFFHAFLGHKEKYIESLNKIIKFLDIYIIIKIILILVTKMGGFNGVELVLLGQIILIYNEKLQRKYIKSINGVEIEKKKNYASLKSPRQRQVAKRMNTKQMTQVVGSQKQTAR